MKICEYCATQCDESTSICPSCGANTFCTQMCELCNRFFRRKLLSCMRRKSRNRRQAMSKLRQRILYFCLSQLRIYCRQKNRCRFQTRKFAFRADKFKKNLALGTGMDFYFSRSFDNSNRSHTETGQAAENHHHYSSLDRISVVGPQLSLPLHRHQNTPQIHTAATVWLHGCTTKICHQKDAKGCHAYRTPLCIFFALYNGQTAPAASLFNRKPPRQSLRRQPVPRPLWPAHWQNKSVQPVKAFPSSPLQCWKAPAHW